MGYDPNTAIWDPRPRVANIKATNSQSLVDHLAAAAAAAGERPCGVHVPEQAPRMACRATAGGFSSKKISLSCRNLTWNSFAACGSPWSLKARQCQPSETLGLCASSSNAPPCMLGQHHASATFAGPLTLPPGGGQGSRPWPAAMSIPGLSADPPRASPTGVTLPLQFNTGRKGSQEDLGIRKDQR